MAENVKVNVEIKLNSGKNCPHREVERVRAAQLKQLCPLCVFQDLLVSAIKPRTLGMKPDVPTPLELGLPKPPNPPVEYYRLGFLGRDNETKESELARARYEGAVEMWTAFMDVLYPQTKPNPIDGPRVL